MENYLLILKVYTIEKLKGETKMNKIRLEILRQMLKDAFKESLIEKQKNNIQ